MAYAYLQKRLPFVTDFDRMRQPLRFLGADGETDVVSFGIEDFALHRPREKKYLTALPKGAEERMSSATGR